MAWAILHDYYDIDGSHRPYLVGYGYFGWERPQHFGGYGVATFESRKIARAAAKKLGGRPKYRAVHVKVKVKPDI